MRLIVTTTVGTKSGNTRGSAREAIIRIDDSGHAIACYDGPVFDTDARFKNDEKGRLAARNAAFLLAREHLGSDAQCRHFRTLSGVEAFFKKEGVEEREQIRIQKVLGTIADNIQIVEAQTELEHKVLATLFAMDEATGYPLVCVYTFDKAKCAMAMDGSQKARRRT